MANSPTFRRLCRQYWLDWSILLILIGIVACINSFVHPYPRYINSEILGTLMYPLKSNTVPSGLVPVIGLLIPFLVILAHFLYKRDKADFHQAMLGLLFALAYMAIIVDSLKNGLGRPRPDFFWRCFPDGNPVFNSNGDVNCTGDVSVIREGHKSFPSGHSSWSFCGLGYLSFYLAGKLRIFDGSGHASKAVLVALPLIGATAVGVTRIDDYWHHWTDVVTGGAIGLATAYLCYRFQFPALWDPNCNKPIISLNNPWKPLTEPTASDEVETGGDTEIGVDSEAVVDETVDDDIEIGITTAEKGRLEESQSFKRSGSSKRFNGVSYPSL